MAEAIYLKNRNSNMASFDLERRNWREFFFEDVLSIDSGKRLTKADMQEGVRPFVGASDSNNGITFFTSSVNESLDSNVLGVNYNGSVGFSFYHPYEALFSDDVKRVKWLDTKHNNRYTLLFLACIIHQQKNKYAYGYKFNGQRMKRQKILLPVDSLGYPDWGFMKAYMKHQEQLILKHTIERLCKQLITNELLGGVNRWTPNGKRSTLQKSLLLYKEVNVLRKPTMWKDVHPMFPQLPSTMAWMDSSEILTA